jgi:hypothetical protein
MHAIEPYFQWRDYYTAENDRRSPFFNRIYDEFEFKNTIYNYYIHPQWDFFGSSTLYMKILYSNYERGFTIIELIGEWNDTLHNDIMYLKRNIADHLIEMGIYKFILICDNVLNFHPSDNLYLEEWFNDIIEENGWVAAINLLDHVYADFEDNYVQEYVYFDEDINELDWRMMKPEKVFDFVDQHIENTPKKLIY